MIELSLEERSAIVHAIAALTVAGELTGVPRDRDELEYSVRVLRGLLARDVEAVTIRAHNGPRR